ncbi:HD domain-containing protein [Candidatus Saccharibacteria bacterium]|nr:HD domain-containing protein [Candidatus Saccharibacteria bacterium]
MFDKAIIFATKAHSGACRKGTDIPYIVHPLEAASIVATMTKDKNVLAAAVLHDVVEDTKYTNEDIKNEFGEEVARLVAAESENKREDLPEAETWRIRKQETIDHLKNHASKNAKIIALGDKLSNIRAIARDYAKLGEEFWNRFNVKDKNEHAWYYKSLVEAFSDLSDEPAYKEYEKLVKEVFD